MEAWGYGGRECRSQVPAEQPEELFDILDEENQGQISFLQFHESVKCLAMP